ncbi:MAG: hypothetical protein M3O70_01635 [Actinomycetota bacterium]|nr:hypothetical protein [Actinomycetota bacterium]
MDEHDVHLVGLVEGCDRCHKIGLGGGGRQLLVWGVIASSAARCCFMRI